MTHHPFLTKAEITALQKEEMLSDKTQKRTKEQIEAIYSHGQNILVSASAGSGKTFVMVERIIDKLKRGVGIDELFISTFTVKAASELKERLEQKLTQEIKETTDNAIRRHLSLQIAALQHADIGTMDAFTQKVVSQYGYLLGISPQFRILQDKSEQDIIKHDVFDHLFDRYMSSEKAELFSKVVINFSGQRKDAKAFYQVVDTIHQFIQSTSDPLNWLETTFDQGAKKYVTSHDLPSTMIEKFLQEMQNVANQLEELTQLPDYKQTTKQGSPTATYKKHQKIYTFLRETAQELEGAFETVNISQLALNLEELLPAGNDVTVAGQKYSLYGQLHQLINQFKHIETIVYYQKQALPLIDLLKDFMADFHQEYLARKKQENAFEFADIGHFAIQILEENNAVRQAFQTKYHEVMVDEYQDTNHSQEKMLELLSSGHNRFMVGDIKQSIYRFRQADPQIFNQKFKDYQDNPENGCLILLKENFRSQIEVLDATNAIFKRLMDEEVGDIDYNDTHSLVAGSDRQLTTDSDNKTEFLIYNTDSVQDETDTEDELTTFEVELVAKEIIKLHKEKKVSFNDITLLVSSRTRNNAIIRTFEQHGIPLVSDGGEQHYLQSVEVMVMLETLRVIDNPLNDYALVALLRSPMFSFDEDEMTRLSLQVNNKKEKAYLYEKLLLTLDKKGSHPELIRTKDYEKVSRFYKQLEKWRTYAKTHSLYDLIWKIYQERHYYDYVGLLPNGEQRQANLYALATRADQFETTGFKGLSRFIRMINKIIETENDLADVEVVAPKEAVSLMTIHKSKGLQFPYVFLLNMDKRFDKRDETAPMILSRDHGIGIKLLVDMKEAFADKSKLPHVLVSMKTLAYQQNQQELTLASLSEQMRLLYVAMTRAEKKLYLVGKGSQEKLSNRYDGQEKFGKLTTASRERLASFQDWVLAVKEAFPNTLTTFSVRYVDQSELSPDKIGKLDQTNPIPTEDLTDNRQSDDIKRALEIMENVDKLNKQYQAAIELPMVKTPSQLKAFYEPVMEKNEMAVMETYQAPFDFSFPDFTNQQKVSPTQIGSAVHELMQRLPITNQVTTEMIKETLSYVDASNAVKEKIDLSKILSFFNTELGQLILENTDKLYREAPFAMLEIDPLSQEPFVIRGIIDGFIKLDDKIILFDYKTDHYKDAAVIKQRYQQQMSLYAKALEKSYQVETVEKYLVLLGGKELEVVKY
ncbi:helicase-exonuclease AddAB subunit AddA [Streptococcus pacificus]|uniref:ATP-dependent helicase/nuclease subunit A n=1 Tax=Streptococcus pacificus TaxID=2740577 RepID=A0ABS0ZHH8_9STRE|nr:helicase-exonuclease AddAB subunit AddA [Streptococcus pacificus]MBJ8325448.1 helicase-exonuclease AddAB subunit AddA [Streptococcus pacificus]